MAATVGAAVLSVAGPAYADPGPNDGHHPGPDPKITSIVVNPSEVVLTRHRDSATVSVTVKGVDLKSAQVYFLPKGHHWGGGDNDGGHGGNDGPWGQKDDAEKNVMYKPTWFSETYSKTIGWNDTVGSWSVRVVAWGVNGRKVFGDSSFFVKHNTWTPPRSPKGTRFVGFNASPEPVKQGRKLTLSGRLQVAQCYGDHYYKWDRARVELDGSSSSGSCYESRKYWHDWYKLGWEDIDVYFLPKGSHKWRYVDTIETNPDGTFYTKVKALKSGNWGVRFEGNRDLAGSEAYDYVKVVK
ncbi:hypothetical protein Acor_26990 [Acrocarpospora corrugata]|uniref:Uncharacterized protein n=1 Tax=Acrocarpospora corrugata TaxID=35763 RepID=A0A5M3VV19_9ACTN|nr:hypothetical protein Acor_26990 [Acrocarpospora corrugata]